MKGKAEPPRKRPEIVTRRSFVHCDRCGYAIRDGVVPAGPSNDRKLYHSLCAAREAGKAPA